MQIIQIYLFPISIKKNLFETMNEELRKVATWFKTNKLSLNISKTKYSLFLSTRKRKHIPNILPPLHIGNVPYKREFATKFLKLYLDKNISWKHHINILSTKVCKSIGKFYKIFFTETILFFFYKPLLELRKYSMGQYKQIHFCKTTTWIN